MESDWKVFREKVPLLRERYLERLNEKLIGILREKDLSETDRFWKAFKRMEKETNVLVECLDGHSRSNMELALVSMIRYGMLRQADLEGFSEELQKRLSILQPKA